MLLSPSPFLNPPSSPLLLILSLSLSHFTLLFITPPFSPSRSPPHAHRTVNATLLIIRSVVVLNDLCALNSAANCFARKLQWFAWELFLHVLILLTERALKAFWTKFLRALSALQMRGSSVVARRAQRQAWNRMILLRFSASSMFIRTDYFSEPIILMEFNGKTNLTRTSDPYDNRWTDTWRQRSCQDGNVSV